MLLYLVQHAEAKREEDDPERGLTDKGFRDIARTAMIARDRGVRVNRVFHSGKKRAAQTAETVVTYLRPPGGDLQADGLAPMDDPYVWDERLVSLNEDIMLVGHLPHLARLASLLLCGDTDRNCVNFQMAGIVCMKRSGDGHWAIEWMIVPELMG
jgi:phosphohistidine phosphatase